MNTQPRYRTPLFRWVTTFVVCVFLYGNLWSILHSATVQHTTCAEHGETIHVESVPAAVQSVDAGGTYADQAVQLRATNPTKSGHEHDHCNICSFSRERLGVTSDASRLGAITPDVTLLTSVKTHEHTSQVTLYHLAPKNSPPVV